MKYTKSTFWFSFAACCLTLAPLGCIGEGEGPAPVDNAAREGTRLAETEQAFTQHADNACTSFCAGSPNGACEPGENLFNCAQDCACGDGICAGSETQQSCPIDCPFGNDAASKLDDACGNGRCDPWEVTAMGILCPGDCKLAPDGPGASCGDYSCDPGETSATCPADCGNAALCGNSLCEPNVGETNATCPWDCTDANIPVGRFLGTECNGYQLVAKYSDGAGGYTVHVVSDLASACGPSYPWKVVSNAGTCNGSTLLKPDGTTCTIANANCTNNVSGTFTLGNKYTMQTGIDPNKCGMFTTTNGFTPLEWSKLDMVTCTAGAPCTVYNCNGTTNTKTSGQAARWVPKNAPWSIYQRNCSP